MADQKQIDQEPSIEEILDSIRQIISDDEDEPQDAAPEPEPPPPPPPPPKPAPKPPVDDVIELTDKIEDQPEPEPEPPPPIQVELKDRNIEPEVRPQPEPEPEPEMLEQEPVEPPMPNDSNFEKLLTNHAENAAVSAFSSLARKTAIERHGGVTIEDIVREEIKPMLRQWLDRNLPDLVEKLVQKELERVSSRVLDD